MSNTRMSKLNFRIPIELKMKLDTVIGELVAHHNMRDKYGVLSDIVRNAISKECNSIRRKIKRENEGCDDG